MIDYRAWLGLSDDDDPVKKALSFLGQGAQPSSPAPEDSSTPAAPAGLPADTRLVDEGPREDPYAWDRTLARPGTEQPIINPDGSVTTERSITVTEPGLNTEAPTNIPTVWGGRVVPDDEAVDNAIRTG